jgi:large subunit ribosomal protein L30
VIEQYRSSIRKPKIQKLQLRALGLGKLGKKKVLPKIPSVTKLVDRLGHLVRIKE